MSYLEEDYDASDLDGEIFLSEAPLSLLMQAIETQFEDPIEYRRKDYVQSFITKYEFCRENQEEINEDYKDELDEYYADFLRFMETIMSQYFGITFPELDDTEDTEALELIHLTYRFFIKGMKKNFIRVVEGYLNDHKDEIVSILPDRKDVTTANFKNRVDDHDDLRILANLDIVVREVLTSEISVEEFLQYTCDGDYMEAEFMTDRYDDVQIVGNFVPQYIQMASEELQYWLEVRLRQRILKKYNKKKKETPEDEFDDSILDE